MKLYLATLHSHGYKSKNNMGKWTNKEREVLNSARNLLDSYWYLKAKKDKINDKIFLDSGAFTAHTKGITISIEEYCDFVNKHHDIISKDGDTYMIATLDNITDALKSYHNYKQMQNYGVPSIPCYHMGEDIRYLYHYRDNNEYISLGGLVGQKTDKLIIWLDTIWGKYLRFSKNKVHGFGLTSLRIMKRYPWHSVDSSSWIQYATYGMIFNEHWGALNISEKSKYQQEWGKHFRTISQIEQRKIKDIINSQGFNFKRLEESFEARSIYNMATFLRLENQINNNQINHNYNSGIFDL